MKHLKALDLRNNPEGPSEESWQSCTDRENPFFQELTEFFMASDIPIDKLNNPAFVQFMERYVRRPLPDARTLRETYVPKIHEKNVTQMQQEVDDNPIYISIDETVDAEQRCVFHAIVSPLYLHEPGIPRLLNEDFYDVGNGENVVEFFNNSLQILWPRGIQYNKVLLFVTDAAPYMVRAGNMLTATYPKLKHVTCLAHGLHRIAETVRECFPDVNGIIANTKSVFSKAPLRVRLFQQMCPNVMLPPAPIITRWGTWLRAASYYNDHYNEVKAVIDALQPDSENVRNVQRYFQRLGNRQDFITIHTNYSILADSIVQLEAQGLDLHASCEIIRVVSNRLLQSPAVNDRVKLKLIQVLTANSDFYDVLALAERCLVTNNFEVVPYNWDVNDVRHMAFAPITSSDVERSFSHYKNILRPNRRSFTQENLKKFVCIHFNKA